MLFCRLRSPRPFCVVVCGSSRAVVSQPRAHAACYRHTSAAVPRPTQSRTGAAPADPRADGAAVSRSWRAALRKLSLIHI
eukprot:3349937-Rhodomonas_salina.1